MPTPVQATFKTIDGQPAAGMPVTFELSESFSSPAGLTMASKATVHTDPAGSISLALVATENADKGQPRYLVTATLKGRVVAHGAINLPDSAEPINLTQLLEIEPPLIAD